MPEIIPPDELRQIIYSGGKVTRVVRDLGDYFFQMDENGTRQICHEFNFRRGFFVPTNPEGPAWIDAYGNKKWFCDGDLFRLDGPAVEYWNGATEWHCEWRGQKHEVKPFYLATQMADWTIDLPRNPTAKVQEKMSAIEAALLLGVLSPGYYNLGEGFAIDFNTKANAWSWTFCGLPHRLDGPARVCRYEHSTKQSWYESGRLHRAGAPAVVVTKDGSRCSEDWAMQGMFHRTDGPARIKYNGQKEWWHLGHLHREGAPAVITPSGRREWWTHGLLDRHDAPAVECGNGSREWWVDGQRHRIDGPAVIRANGGEQWWREGRPVHPPELVRSWGGGGNKWHRR